MGRILTIYSKLKLLQLQGSVKLLQLKCSVFIIHAYILISMGVTNEVLPMQVFFNNTQQGYRKLH